MNFFACPHNNQAPLEVLKALKRAQSNPGGHSCAVCAFAQGVLDGKSGDSTAPQYTCRHQAQAPLQMLENLDKYQGESGVTRHKCATCAYSQGYQRGSQQAEDPQWMGIAQQSLETESVTHGVFDDEYEPDSEGKKRIGQHVFYERSKRNRAAALKFHGTQCAACGFDFDAFYGADFARHYIEIHHTKPLATLKGALVDPKVDLVPLCSNCHSMMHRDQNQTFTVENLKERIGAAKERLSSTE